MDEWLRAVVAIIDPFSCVPLRSPAGSARRKGKKNTAGRARSSRRRLSVSYKDWNLGAETRLTERFKTRQGEKGGEGVEN